MAEAELMVDRAKPNPEFAATIAARKALEGHWEVVSIEEDGGASPKPDIKSITDSWPAGDVRTSAGNCQAF